MGEKKRPVPVASIDCTQGGRTWSLVVAPRSLLHNLSNKVNSAAPNSTLKPVTMHHDLRYPLLQGTNSVQTASLTGARHVRPTFLTMPVRSCQSLGINRRRVDGSGAGCRSEHDSIP